MAQARKKPKTEPDPGEGFFPEGHSFIKDEALEGLIAAQREAAAGARATEERWANQLKIASSSNETMFSGLQVATRAMGDEIARLTMRNVDQDRKVLEYQAEIHDRNHKISEMERQSEEARLKREDQAHQLKAKALDIEAKALELNAEKEKFRATLKLMEPLMMAGGMGLKDWITEKMSNRNGAAGAGAGGGLPGPVPAGPTNGAANGAANGGPNGAANGHAPGPRFRVTMDCIAEWRQFVTLAFANIKPETAALLRALVAAGFSTGDGPKMPMDTVIQALRADLGDEAMLGFMRLTGMGWAEVDVAPPQATQAAN